MIAHNSNLLCKQAQLHYYDFWCNESTDLIPESIAHHIQQCQNCQEQMDRLKVALSQAEAAEPEQNHGGSAITRMLKLHFAYIGKQVTCSTVRPFLPALLDPALQIRTPTPITAHLGNCQQCSDDLEAIRGLSLNRRQLYRLSQLFAKEPPQDSAKCSNMSEISKSVAAMDLGGISAEALKHVCKCTVCRESLYEERQDLCDSLPECDQSPEFPCESVATKDIFDYVVPYGLDPASDQHVEFRKSFVVHLRTCPKCLAKMQQLHKTVYGITERAESGVVTVFHIDEPDKTQAAAESGDPYAGFPIRVEMPGCQGQADPKQSVSTIAFGAALKRKASAMNLKLLVKAASVAAVILVAVALLLNAPAARAVTIGQIYEAFEKAMNVHISKFAPDKTEPIEEQWVSRSLNIYMTKSGNELVLWDISNGLQKTKQLDTGLTETVPLTSDLRTSVESKMSGSLGLTPFYDLSRIPKDAKWSPVPEADAEALAEKTEVYDLTWTRYGGSVTFRLRFFVEAETNRPRKTEFYQKSAPETEYRLRSVMVFEYLSDSEIQALVSR